ncbi:helix-turn-helix domain-containing protein [Staphylococcus taiwanensis]|nr:helix-turn-helix domain-containing protein [Staphylococcus taiwanensis]
MHSIINYASSHAFDYKTNKSIYNILSGKKSHQTFFDACSQQLLSLYHSLPKLKYPSFERYIEPDVGQTIQIKVHPRVTYDSLQNTFNCIQLLVQTITHYLNSHLDFIPVSQHSNVHIKAKKLYLNIINNNRLEDLKKELINLFEIISDKCEGRCFLHYYLQGFEEPMYTRQQISMIENVSVSDLYIFELNNLVEMMFALEQKEKFPLLSDTMILPSLLNKTATTFHQLEQGLSMDEVSVIQNVKINTIEDHVLELFIKGYYSNYQNYIDETLIRNFVTYYCNQRGQRLKNYKNQFEELTYFQIKLIIVGVERGDLFA